MEIQTDEADNIQTGSHRDTYNIKFSKIKDKDRILKTTKEK